MVSYMKVFFEQFKAIMLVSIMMLSPLCLASTVSQMSFSKTQVEKMLPAEELRNIPVIHKDLLRSQLVAVDEHSLFLTINSQIPPIFVKDGQLVIYLSMEGRLMLHDLVTKQEQVLRNNVRPQAIELIAHRSIYLADEHMLIDLSGNLVKQWGRDELLSVVEQPSKNMKLLMLKKYIQHPKLGDRCAEVTVYDGDMSEWRSENFGKNGFEHCEVRISDDDVLEVLGLDDASATYIANDKKQMFKGQKVDKRGGETAIYQFLENQPYIVSYGSHNKNDHTIWSLSTGKAVCRSIAPLVNLQLASDTANSLYVDAVPRRVQLPSCSVEQLSDSGQVFFDADMYWIYKSRTRELLGYGADNDELIYRLNSMEDYSEVTIERVVVHGKAYIVLEGNLRNQVNGYAKKVEIHDLNRIALIGSFYRKSTVYQLPNMSYMLLEKSSSRFSASAEKTYSINFMIKHDGSSIILSLIENNQDLLEQMEKSKFETSSDYDERLKDIKESFALETVIKDYDADQEVFHTVWRGMPLGVPVSIGQAKQMANYRTLQIEGELIPLDEQFLLLDNAHIKLNDGDILPLESSAHLFKPEPEVEVKEEVSEPVSEAVVAESVLGALANINVIPAEQSCDGTFSYLSKKIQPFTAPTLAKVRGIILSLDIQNELQALKQRNEGLDQLQLKNQQIQLNKREMDLNAKQIDLAEATELIQQFEDGELPLDFACESEMQSAICNYMLQSWRLLANEELMSKVQSCSNN